MANPLKVAICSWCYGIGGGAARMETFYHQFYNREHFEPHFISLVKRPVGEPEYDSSIPYIPVNQSDRFSHLLKILKDFDVIQFQGSFDPIVCEAAKYLAKPHVLLEVLHNIETGGLYNNIDGIVCVSNAVAKAQNEGANYRTILNGINLKSFPLSKDKKQNDKIILLQVARKSKLAICLDEINTEILALNPKIEIWIAGDYQGESTDRLKYLGKREDVYELYKQAHFTVLMSKEEPFGLVAIESMASGTPVILSRSGGFLDILENENQGFFVDGPTKEKAIEVIESAIKIIGTSTYDQLINNGRRRVEEAFSIEKCINQYENYILELYEAKKAQPVKTLELPRVLPHVLIGEALYDSHANDLEALAGRLRELVSCGQPITERYVLFMANKFGKFLKHHRPDLYPRGLPLYLFSTGDGTEATCNELLNDLDFVKQHGMFEQVYRFFEQTKSEYPERWQRINQKS